MIGKPASDWMKTGKTALSGPRSSPTQSHNPGEKGSTQLSPDSPQLPEREAGVLLARGGISACGCWEGWSRRAGHWEGEILQKGDLRKLQTYTLRV